MIPRLRGPWLPVVEGRIALRDWLAHACLLLLLAAGVQPAHAAEPTATMRALAQVFVALDARDLSGYCGSRLTAPYGEYLARSCQSAVLNKIKTAEDCSQERISQQARIDAAQCLARPPAEFEKAVAVGEEARIAFLREVTVQGIDGDQLMQDARAKRR